MLFLTNRMPMITSGSFAVRPMPLEIIKTELMKGFISQIDSKELSEVSTAVLGIAVPEKQMDIAPRVGEDTVVLVQSSMDLPKGAKVLPQGCVLTFSAIKAAPGQNTTVTEDVAKITQSGVGLLRKVARALF